ncbi:MAG: pyruvate dehydrogenase (acetyl-transferring) E1 component subunit alpha [Lysobacterales bacterium]
MSVIARFEIEHRAYLDADGKPLQDLPALASQRDEVLELYRLMSLVRVFDGKAVALQRTGKLGTYASCLGHEATHVAIGAAMRDEDVLAPMYREYGAQIRRGVRPREILLYWGGDERGNDFQQEPARHDFPWCVPISTQCLYAAGTALAFRIRGEARAAVCVCGDGGTSKADFYGALNVAGARQLPLVMVVVNNQWAISVPRHLQTGAQTLAQKAIAGGIHGLQVDGNDLFAVHEAMSEALQRARDGQGATLIEAVTYRLSDHTTADDARRYRDAAEVEAAQTREPLRRLRNWLTEQGWWSDADEQAWLSECRQQIDAEVEAYLSTPRPPIASMFQHVYADMPPDLQRQWREVEGFAGGTR